jgi:hypothetical protein
MPDLPRSLDRVLEQTLAKKPEDRYASRAALVRAVEQAWGLAEMLPEDGR